jgi:hypothetical protein
MLMATVQGSKAPEYRVKRFMSIPAPSWVGVLFFLWFGVWIGTSSGETKQAVISAIVASVAILLVELTISLVRRVMARS